MDNLFYDKVNCPKKAEEFKNKINDKIIELKFQKKRAEDINSYINKLDLNGTIKNNLINKKINVDDIEKLKKDINTLEKSINSKIDEYNSIINTITNSSYYKKCEQNKDINNVILKLKSKISELRQDVHNLKESKYVLDEYKDYLKSPYIIKKKSIGLDLKQIISLLLAAGVSFYLIKKLFISNKNQTKNKNQKSNKNLPAKIKRRSII